MNLAEFPTLLHLPDHLTLEDIKDTPILRQVYTNAFGLNILSSDNLSFDSCSSIYPNRHASFMRSLNILWHYLTPVQRRQLVFSHHFWVRGKSGERYSISLVPVSNIKRFHRDVNGEMHRHVYCVCMTTEYYPDMWLGQKIYLEADDFAFLSMCPYHYACDEPLFPLITAWWRELMAMPEYPAVNNHHHLLIECNGSDDGRRLVIPRDATQASYVQIPNKATGGFVQIDGNIVTNVVFPAINVTIT